MSSENITKTMRYEVIKPVNCEWKELGSVLNNLSWQFAKMANFLVTHLWNQDMQRNIYKQMHGEYPKEKGINTYQLLREQFPEVGTKLVNQLDRVVQKKYRSERKEIFSNKRSLPTYRSIPICVNNQAWNLIQDKDNSFIVDVLLLPKDAECTRYKFLIKYKSRGQKAILEKLATGEYKKGMLQIFKDKHGKWYAAPSFSFQKKVDDTPIQKTLTVTPDPEGIALQAGEQGSIQTIPIDDIIHTLAKFRSRQSKIFTQRRYRGQGRIGHGRKALFKPQKPIEDKLANFKNTKNHNLSRYIVDYAKRYRCSDILIAGTPFIEDWTTFDLCNKIIYKAKEAGITAVKE